MRRVDLMFCWMRAGSQDGRDEETERNRERETHDLQDAQELVILGLREVDGHLVRDSSVIDCCTDRESATKSKAIDRETRNSLKTLISICLPSSFSSSKASGVGLPRSMTISLVWMLYLDSAGGTKDAFGSDMATTARRGEKDVDGLICWAISASLVGFLPMRTTLKPAFAIC